MDTVFVNSTTYKIPDRFRLLMNVRVLFGLYYDGGHSKAISATLKIYCFLLSLSGLIFFFYFFPIQFNQYRFYVNIEFGFNLVVCLYLEDKYYVKFVSKMATIDKILNLRNSVIRIDFLTIQTLLFLARAYFVIWKISNFIDILMSLITFLQVMAHFLWRLPTFIVFHVLYRRMCTLRNIFERKIFGSKFNIVGFPKPTTVVYLKKYLLVYNELIENFQHDDIGLQLTLLITMVFNFPKLVLLSYTLIKLIVCGGDVITFAYTIYLTMYCLIVVSLPGYYAELASAETEKIKLLLINQLTRCTNTDLRSEIHHALELISLRPFKYSVCRAIPINGKLPLRFIALCYTYVIVVVQFVKF